MTQIWAVRVFDPPSEESGLMMYKKPKLDQQNAVLGLSLIAWRKKPSLLLRIWFEVVSSHSATFWGKTAWEWSQHKGKQSQEMEIKFWCHTFKPLDPAMPEAHISELHELMNSIYCLIQFEWLIACKKNFWIIFNTYPRDQCKDIPL